MRILEAQGVREPLSASRQSLRSHAKRWVLLERVGLRTGSPRLVEMGDGGLVVSIELEVEHVKVALDWLGRERLWDHHEVIVEMPTEIT